MSVASFDAYFIGIRNFDRVGYDIGTVDAHYESLRCEKWLIDCCTTATNNAIVED